MQNLDPVDPSIAYKPDESIPLRVFLKVLRVLEANCILHNLHCPTRAAARFRSTQDSSII